MANGPMPLDRARPLTGGDLKTQRTLGEYPAGEYVNLRCLKCERTGRLRKDRLLAEYGPDIGLVSLINLLAPKDCPLNAPDIAAGGHRPCGACYADLTGA